MSWTVTADELAEGLEGARREVGEYRDWDTLEKLARALRWVDEVDESRRTFQAAARTMLENLAEDGVDAGEEYSRTAGYFALAGDLGSARPWAARAVESLLRGADDDEWGRREIAHAVETLYVCGGVDRALALAGQHALRGPAVELIEAERDGRVAVADAVIERVARDLVAERVPPFEAYTQYPVDPWDWLELAFEARARIAREPAPSHRQMLERAGLLGAGRSARGARLEGGGVDRFAVPAADGSAIEATVDRTSPDWVEIVLDPRPRPYYLALGFNWHDDVGYSVPLYTAPESSPQQSLPYRGRDFREAVAATSDWLDGEEVFDRDGTWAARTLREITKDLPVHEV